MPCKLRYSLCRPSQRTYRSQSPNVKIIEKYRVSSPPGSQTCTYICFSRTFQIIQHINPAILKSAPFSYRRNVSSMKKRDISSSSLNQLQSKKFQHPSLATYNTANFLPVNQFQRSNPDISFLQRLLHNINQFLTTFLAIGI